MTTERGRRASPGNRDARWGRMGNHAPRSAQQGTMGPSAGSLAMVSGGSRSRVRTGFQLIDAKSVSPLEEVEGAKPGQRTGLSGDYPARPLQPLRRRSVGCRIDGKPLAIFSLRRWAAVRCGPSSPRRAFFLGTVTQGAERPCAISPRARRRKGRATTRAGRANDLPAAAVM